MLSLVVCHCQAGLCRAMRYYADSVSQCHGMNHDKQAICANRATVSNILAIRAWLKPSMYLHSIAYMHTMLEALSYMPVCRHCRGPRWDCQGDSGCRCLQRLPVAWVQSLGCVRDGSATGRPAILRSNNHLHKSHRCRSSVHVQMACTVAT